MVRSLDHLVHDGRRKKPWLTSRHCLDRRTPEGSVMEAKHDGGLGDLVRDRYRWRTRRHRGGNLRRSRGRRPSCLRVAGRHVDIVVRGHLRIIDVDGGPHHASGSRGRPPSAMRRHRAWAAARSNAVIMDEAPQCRRSALAIDAAGVGGLFHRGKSILRASHIPERASRVTARRVDGVHGTAPDQVRAGGDWRPRNLARCLPAGADEDECSPIRTVWHHWCGADGS